MSISADNLLKVREGKAALYEDKGQAVIHAVNPRSLGYRLVSWIVDIGNFLGRSWLSDRLPLKDPDRVLKAIGHIEDYKDRGHGLREWVPESPAQVQTLAERFQRQITPGSSGKRLGLAERIAQGQSIVTMLHHTVKNERTLYQAIRRELEAAGGDLNQEVLRHFALSPASFSEQLNQLPAEQVALLGRPVRDEPAQAEADLAPIARHWMMGRNQAAFTALLDAALEGNARHQVDRQQAWRDFVRAQGLEGAKALQRRPAQAQAFDGFIQGHLLRTRAEQIGRLLGARDTDTMRNAAMAKANAQLAPALGQGELTPAEQATWFKAFFRGELATQAVQGLLDKGQRQALGPAGSDERLRQAADLLEADCAQRFAESAGQARDGHALGEHLRAVAQASLVQVLGPTLALCASGLEVIEGTRLDEQAKTRLKERLPGFIREAQALSSQAPMAVLAARIRMAAVLPDGLPPLGAGGAYRSSATAAYLEASGISPRLIPEQEAALATAVQRLGLRGYDPGLLRNLAAELAARQEPLALAPDGPARRTQLRQLAGQLESRLEEMAILALLPGLRPETVFEPLLPQVNRVLGSLAALGAGGASTTARREVEVAFAGLSVGIAAAGTRADAVGDNARSLFSLSLARRQSTDPAEAGAATPAEAPRGFELYLARLSAGLDALGPDPGPSASPGTESAARVVLGALREALAQARA